MKIKDLGKPVFVSGGWSVYTDGMITGKYTKVGGSFGTVTIYPDRLVESDLLVSMMVDKVTDEWNHVFPVYIAACRQAGIKEIPNFKIVIE